VIVLPPAAEPLLRDLAPQVLGRVADPRGSRRMVDQIRRDSARRQREHDAALDLGQIVAAASVESRADEDDTLTAGPSRPFARRAYLSKRRRVWPVPSASTRCSTCSI
jgi:hypothetical protein